MYNEYVSVNGSVCPTVKYVDLTSNMCPSGSHVDGNMCPGVTSSNAEELGCQKVILIQTSVGTENASGSITYSNKGLNEVKNVIQAYFGDNYELYLHLPIALIVYHIFWHCQ